MERRQSGREQRLALRTAVEYRVRFKSELLEFDTSAEVDGEVMDMSRGGMFIRSDFLEAPGTPVALLVWLPEREEPVALRGVVAWVAEHPPKGPGMGIKLTQGWES